MSKPWRELVAVLVLSALVCLISVGCQSPEATKSASAETEGVVVDPLNPPKGRVMRVWRNRDSIVGIGTEVGVADGDCSLGSRDCQRNLVAFFAKKLAGLG